MHTFWMMIYSYLRLDPLLFTWSTMCMWKVVVVASDWAQSDFFVMFFSVPWGMLSDNERCEHTYLDLIMVWTNAKNFITI